MQNELYRIKTEAMYYDLKQWTLEQLDNENVSDGLYGYVKNMIADLKRELTEIELEYFNR